MEKSKVMASGEDQALNQSGTVSLTDGSGLDGGINADRDQITAIGNGTWDAWFDGIGVDADAMTDRIQPLVQERQKF